MKNIITVIAISFFGFISNAQELEVFAESEYPINGIAISKKSGRKFVSMPQWLNDKKSYSVAELKEDGSIVPFPGNNWNEFNPENKLNSFINVNSVFIDEDDFLWVVDYAAPFFGDIVDGGQKVVKFNLNLNKVESVYTFDDESLPEHAKINDIRVDTHTQKAFISEFGTGAIIVLDLKTGMSHRVLDQHYSTKSHPDVVSYFLGEKFSTAALQVNDIELTQDNSYLLYQPTGGPILYRIKTSDLINEDLSEREMSERVEVFSKSTTVGGVTIDEKDNLYLGAVEYNSIIKIDKKGKTTTLITDDNLLWPDAMSIYDKYLYIPCPQLRLLPNFSSEGQQYISPFKVYRMKL